MSTDVGAGASTARLLTHGNRSVSEPPPSPGPPRFVVLSVAVNGTPSVTGPFRSSYSAQVWADDLAPGVAFTVLPLEPPGRVAHS